MSGFDTHVEGSPASVRAAAHWLRGPLKTALSVAGDDVVSARSHAMSGFEGLAGQAYADYDKTLLTHIDAHETTIGQAATVFDHYAARLQQYKERMRAIRTKAAGGGLTVSGTVVQAPPDAAPVPALPPAASQEAQDAHDHQVKAHDAAVAKITLYNKLLGDATDERAAFADWTDANVTAVVGTFDTPAIDKLWDVVAANAGNLGVALGAESGAKYLESRKERLEAKAEDMRRARRSGNPARRASAGSKGAIRDLLEESKWLGRGGKVLGPAGTAYDVYQGLESDHPAGGLVAAGVGAGATALVIATAPVSVPAVVVVGGAVVVGAGVAYGVNAGWDALPDSFTDPIDDAVGDAWDSTKDVASDGWNEVKSWF